jgi:2-polyprenyl-3-methyl-5-hydroxy-6-metoxy-1,4-benzoquinol methylase
MPEIVSHCPLCGNSASLPFDQRQFRGHPVINVICRQCGLVYQSPRMTEAESQAFYQAEYRLLYQGQEGPTPKDLAVQAVRARVSLEFSHRYIHSAARLLDIGCSTGILLKHFRDYYQAQAMGVEPGDIYREYAQSLGLEIYASLDELKQVCSARFSLVSMLHVLEHLPDPLGYLQDLRTQFLEPTSWLLLEVPNLFAHDCFEVAHLVSFSRHTLTQLLRKAGYRVVRLRAHGLPRSRLIPLYLTLLAQPDPHTPASIKPDRLVKLQRRLGFLHRKIAERLFPRLAWISLESI